MLTGETSGEPNTTLAIPVSIGDGCTTPYVDSTGKPCEWYEWSKSTAGDAGSCTCQFDLQRASQKVIGFPGEQFVKLTNMDLGFGTGFVVYGVGAAVWLGLGYMIWKSTKGGR